MLLKTKGIILHTIKYADKKVICKIYTRDFGVQAYIVNVGNSARSKIKPAILLPLTQLELEVFSKQNKLPLLHRHCQAPMLCCNNFL